MTWRTLLEAAFVVREVGNRWSMFSQSLLGVKHPVGIICIKFRAETSLLTLMATQRKIRMSYPKETYEPLKNRQRPKPFALRYFNTPLAYKVCLIVSFIYQNWPLISLFYSPRPKREAKYGKERTSTSGILSWGRSACPSRADLHLPVTIQHRCCDFTLLSPVFHFIYLALLVMPVRMVSEEYKSRMNVYKFSAGTKFVSSSCSGRHCLILVTIVPKWFLQ